jgi:hypothetical protein
MQPTQRRLRLKLRSQLKRWCGKQDEDEVEAETEVEVDGFDPDDLDAGDSEARVNASAGFLRLHLPDLRSCIELAEHRGANDHVTAQVHEAAVVSAIIRALKSWSVVRSTHKTSVEGPAPRRRRMIVSLAPLLLVC